MPGEHLLKAFGLRDGAREPIENEPVVQFSGGDRILNQGNDDGIGHQFSLGHVGFGLATEGSSLVDRLAQHSPGGQVKQAFGRREASRLCTLAGTGRTKKDQVHTYIDLPRIRPFFRKPS